MKVLLFNKHDLFLFLLLLKIEGISDIFFLKVVFLFQWKISHLFFQQDVVLSKTTGSLGFSIIGGTDHSSVPFGSKEPGIFISHVRDVTLNVCSYLKYIDCTDGSWWYGSFLWQTASW